MAVNFLKNKVMRMLSSSLHNELLKKDIVKLEIEKKLWKVTAENTLAKSEMEKKLLTAENSLLKIQIKEQNWDLLKVHQQLHLRTFLVLFCNRHINSQPGEKFKEKLTKFLYSRKESLNDWEFNEKLFVESLTKFYSRINKNAHPE